jgi:hypothetical protein
MTAETSLSVCPSYFFVAKGVTATARRDGAGAAALPVWSLLLSITLLEYGL